jgi:hypothetical protein
MKILIFILCFLLTASHICSQNYREIEEGLTVVALKGLNIRSSPSTSGKVLASVPFGEVVIPVEYDGMTKKDTIENLKGEWLKVVYNKIEGFAFSPYLIENLSIDRAKSSDEMILLMEGVPGWFTAYEPDFYYYGLYENNDSQKWEKINVSFLVATIHGIDKFSDEHCLGDFPNIKISTDRSEISKLIIGSRKPIIPDKILNIFFSKNDNYYSNSGFLYPEQIFSTQYNDVTYNIRAFDSISVDFKNKTFDKHYQLQFYTGYNKRYEYSGLQNISNELELYDSGERHSFYQTPAIDWIGDINGDGLLDVVIYQHGMVEHGGTHWQHTLFLGKKVKEKIFLQKVWSYLIGSCV